LAWTRRPAVSRTVDPAARDFHVGRRRLDGRTPRQGDTAPFGADRRPPSGASPTASPVTRSAPPRSRKKRLLLFGGFANTLSMANAGLQSNGAAPAGMFVYFSDLLSRTVVDAAGTPIGRLWDLSIGLPEPYPPVRQVLVRPRGQTDLLLVAEASAVRSWTASPIPLSASIRELWPSWRKEKTEILLREALLD